MSNRRVREKKENKAWTDKDVENFYKENAKKMRTEHSKGVSFWSNVKYYANKTVCKKRAEIAYDLHREKFHKAAKMV